MVQTVHRIGGRVGSVNAHRGGTATTAASAVRIGGRRVVIVVDSDRTADAEADDATATVLLLGQIVVEYRCGRIMHLLVLQQRLVKLFRHHHTLLLLIGRVHHVMLLLNLVQVLLLLQLLLLQHCGGHFRSFRSSRCRHRRRC